MEPDQNIVVIGRESGSGTRDAFEEILDIADQCQLAQTLNETGAVSCCGSIYTRSYWIYFIRCFK